jgi:hypothetical protein
LVGCSAGQASFDFGCHKSISNLRNFLNEEGLKLRKQAAELGDPKAQMFLSHHKEQFDIERAKFWCRKAAKQNDFEAIQLLASYSQDFTLDAYILNLLGKTHDSRNLNQVC